MPTVRFTRNIQRHVTCPTEAVSGATLGAALDSYFAAHHDARGYVLSGDPGDELSGLAARELDLDQLWERT